MVGYWCGLAKDGDPHVKGQPAWPRYDTTDPKMVLDLTLGTETALDKDLCDFWDGIAP